MPDSIASTADPIEVFAYSATISDELAARVEAEMSDLEVAAAITAEPTPYVHEVVTGCRDTGRTVTIVSNNSARAVHAYLAQHGLDDRIPLVIARTSHDPALLKPDPYLINQAVAALAAEPGECALVGDSTTDVEGAQLASVHAIGYANKPGKSERLAQAGAGAVITSLADLAIRLRTQVSGL
jgi:phosphoglycolate phosphatase